MAGKLLRSIADLGEVNDRAEVIAEVPEWDAQIRFLTPTLARLIDLDRKRSVLDDSAESRVESLILPIVASAVDADGIPLFSDDATIGWLRERNFDVLLRLGRIAAKVCGANTEDTETAQGESEGTPAEG